MSELKSKFTKKLSPLIEGQVPDFVQADHPVFVDFVKDYFKFLEAGKLSISGEIDYVIQETKTTAFILEETDGDRIVTELHLVLVRSLLMVKRSLVEQLVQRQLFW